MKEHRHVLRAWAIFSVTVSAVYCFNPKLRLIALCEIGYCCTLMKTRTAAHSWFDPHTRHSLFFVFPSDVWCKINKLLKYEYQLTKRCLGGIKAFPKSLQRRNSRPGQAKRTAEPFQIETGVPNWFRRRTFHVLNVLGSAREKFGVWTRPKLLTYLWQGKRNIFASFTVQHG